MNKFNNYEIIKYIKISYELNKFGSNIRFIRVLYFVFLFISKIMPPICYSPIFHEFFWHLSQIVPKNNSARKHPRTNYKVFLAYLVGHLSEFSAINFF